jgi:multiple sugar transport system substrate-binding protein
MNIELNLSVAMPEHFQEAAHFYQGCISPALESESVTLKIEAIPWEALWHYIQTMTLSKSGLDLSEVGTTWISSLADFNAPRSFSPDEIGEVGGQAIFTPTAWERASLLGDSRILSIPWLTDTRVIYFWKDMVDRVALDVNKAFLSIEETRASMARLHAAGIPAWGAPTFKCNNNVHHMASWIWANGEDFVSSDGKRTTFCTPRALAGMAEYLELFEYMPRPFDSLDDLARAFEAKEVAVVMDGPWLLTRLMDNQNRRGGTIHLGVALPPGAPFVGGSNLVIWNHIGSDRLNAAIKLVAWLVSPEVQRKASEATGLLPVRRDLLDGYPYTTHPNYKVLLAAEHSGRHLPRIPMWGAMENSLVNIFGMIWQRIKASGTGQMTDVLRQHLEPLAKRFDKVMGLF